MKKYEALDILNSRINNDQIDKRSLWYKGGVKNSIRELAYNDEGFENVVFELGCSVLAKAYCRSKNIQK